MATSLYLVFEDEKESMSQFKQLRLGQRDSRFSSPDKLAAANSARTKMGANFLGGQKEGHLYSNGYREKVNLLRG